MSCASDGVLGFTMQLYSDRGCAIPQGNPVPFTPSTTNPCSPFTQPQLYGVSLLGNYVVGYCQLSPAVTSASTTVLAATQTLTGTITDTPKFRSTLVLSIKSALASQCPSCTVTIVSVTTTSSRRQLLAAGATVVYNVAAPTATVTPAALQTSITSSTTATALTTALSGAGITVTAATPTVTTVTSIAPIQTPTSSPTMAPTAMSATSVAALLSTSGAAVTTALAAAYSGIQVSNPVVTTLVNLVNLTLNPFLT